MNILAKRKDAEYGLNIVAIEDEYKQSGRKTGGISVAFMFLAKFPLVHIKIILRKLVGKS